LEALVLSEARALSALRDPLGVRDPLEALVLSEARALSALKDPLEVKDLLGVLAPSGAKGPPDRQVSSWSCLPARRKACLGVKDLLGAKAR